MSLRVVPTRPESTAVRFDGSTASYRTIKNLFPHIVFSAWRVDAPSALLSVETPDQLTDLPIDHWLTVDDFGHCAVWTDAEFEARFVPVVDRG